MKSAASILQVVGRTTGLILLVLGIIFWTGRALQLIPLHMLLGSLLVLTLLTQAILAARAGVNRAVVTLAILWGPIMLAFGMAQANLFPGQFHWVIRVLHLAVGVAAIGMVDGLGKQVSAGGRSGDLHAAGART